MSQSDNFEIITNPDEELLDFSDTDENSYDNTRDEVLKDIIPSFTNLIESIYDEIYQKSLEPLLNCECYDSENSNSQEISNLKTHIKQLEEKCLEETQQNDTLRVSLEKLNETYRSLVEENNSMLYENSQNTTEMSQLQIDLSEILNQYNELKRDYNSVLNENERFKSEIVKKSSEIDNLKIKFNSSSCNENDLRDAYNNLFEDFEKLRRTNDVLNTSLKESEAGEIMLQRQLENCIDSVKESHTTIKELKEKIRLLEEDNSKSDLTSLNVLANVCSKEQEKLQSETNSQPSRYNLRSRKSCNYK